MKIPFCPKHAPAAAFFLALSCAANLYAAPDQTPIEPATGCETLNLDELTTPESLRLAYYILLPGNHNYQGHRADAMTEISAAAQSFGMDLKKRGKGKEDQKKSDGRLVLARRLLEPLRARLISEEDRPTLERINKALEKITLALKARELDENGESLKQPDADQ